MVDRRIIAVVLPDGYAGASDFAKDCGVEVIPRRAAADQPQ